MRVLTVDPSDPFLATLAARLADGTLWPGGSLPADPLALADATVYLPTRRAARALAAAVLAAAPGGATVLPRIEALGDPDEAPEGRPHVLSRTEARVVLARLVRAWAATIEARDAGQRTLHPTSGPDAVRLADDLLALMDQVETQEADWAGLPKLVADTDLAEHWQITTRFLTIATEAWPKHLAATGRITEAAARRADAEAAAERVRSARGPIVVAGSTGSIPGTRRLIAAIAGSPWGVVVLPGFDRAADEGAWQALASSPDAPGHPQYGMMQLVEALGIAPRDVVRLAPQVAPKTPPSRTDVLAAALRPARDTGRWRADRDRIGNLEAALDGVTLVEAADEREEAAAIAVAMRGSVALGETVALVTPHRALARRVVHQLRRWDLHVDDSGGEPLAGTAAGVLARLVATVAFGGGAAEWLALLKHVGARFRADDAWRGVAEVETKLRGPRVAPHRMLTVMRAAGEDAASLATIIEAAFVPLLALTGREASVGAFAAAHAVVLDAIAAPDLPAREPVDALLAELAQREELAVTASDWPATFEALLDGIVVRARPQDDAVRILGPLEARLQSFDHAVLGGLNEGTWPASPDAGPWMSRGMMSAFGIDLPERRIGLSAHDFMTAAHQTRVTMTRARKAAGEPTVASRWWLRLTAFAGPADGLARARGDTLIALAGMLEDRPSIPVPTRPAPAPPLAVRPTSFRVTEVARLVRDPYAVYAQRVLCLEPLAELEQEPGAGDRGELFHIVLARFVGERHHRKADAQAQFFAIADQALQSLDESPDAKVLWGARLRHIAPFVVAMEAERAAAVTDQLVEFRATATLADGLTLRGRIDRLDLGAAGAEVIDYKTGRAPTKKEVGAFLEPQLPLEAALVRAGAVEGVPADVALAALSYVAVASGRVPIHRQEVAADDSAALADEARARLERLHALYRDPVQGYLSRARPKFASDLDGDYDHLARAAEWTTA